jgi:hypothetical protein
VWLSSKRGNSNHASESSSYAWWYRARAHTGANAKGKSYEPFEKGNFNIVLVFRLGKHTVFLLPETSGDLVKTANLECTHLMHSKLALFTDATARGDLAAGCMEAGIRLA